MRRPGLTRAAVQVIFPGNLMEKLETKRPAVTRQAMLSPTAEPSPTGTISEPLDEPHHTFDPGVFEQSRREVSPRRPFVDLSERRIG